MSQQTLPGASQAHELISKPSSARTIYRDGARATRATGATTKVSKVPRPAVLVPSFFLPPLFTRSLTRARALSRPGGCSPSLSHTLPRPLGVLSSDQAGTRRVAGHRHARAWRALWRNRTPRAKRRVPWRPTARCTSGVQRRTPYELPLAALPRPPCTRTAPQAQPEATNRARARGWCWGGEEAARVWAPHKVPCKGRAVCATRCPRKHIPGPLSPALVRHQLCADSRRGVIAGTQGQRVQGVCPRPPTRRRE